ncbi:siderophore-interacting protein [Mycolicibacterium sp. 120266]|uniref:siderophore-interacting protein n=1 Tax=Mycolicibacterium sp. 120266 TaxID=3090601 RepID=UPI00299EAD6B|nr:siderophore-interacting protein [Mycolicibacterium sp. 120266]MDX1874587.1 siderophore-interacting protein [Mycolicibacterium sp. 120266]
MGVVQGAVTEVSQIGPRIRRVVFEVPEIAALGLPAVGDAAVGIYFPSLGPADPDAETDGRNYTVRHADGRHLTCDFVLHETGLATCWVRRATPGQRVQLDHARSWYRPEPASVWQLLVADLSGLPALARILEELPQGAAATAIVEVADEDDLAYLPARPDIPRIVTIGSGNGHAPSALPDLVRAYRHPDGRGYCWFAGEAQATRVVRKHLRGACGWVADQYDIVGYWRFDSETWDRRYAAVSAEVEATYERALAAGKGPKIAAEEYDLALERAGL